MSQFFCSPIQLSVLSFLFHARFSGTLFTLVISRQLHLSRKANYNNNKLTTVFADKVFNSMRMCQVWIWDSYYECTQWMEEMERPKGDEEKNQIWKELAQFMLSLRRCSSVGMFLFIEYSISVPVTYLFRQKKIHIFSLAPNVMGDQHFKRKNRWFLSEILSPLIVSLSMFPRFAAANTKLWLNYVSIWNFLIFTRLHHECV